MKLQCDFIIRNDEDGCFFVSNGTKQVIPKQYESIINALKNGVTEETKIIGKLIENGMPETEAALLCAAFVIEYSDLLVSEQ